MLSTKSYTSVNIFTGLEIEPIQDTSKICSYICPNMKQIILLHDVYSISL